jgi:hypothetical protein
LVGEEERETAGGLVYVLSGAARGVENAPEGRFTYVPAATPALDVEATYDYGQLRSGVSAGVTAARERTRDRGGCWQDGREDSGRLRAGVGGCGRDEDAPQHG